MKKLFKKLSSIFTFMCMIVTLMPSTIVFASTSGGVKQIEVSGSSVYVYTPEDPSTNGLMTPIVVLYGQNNITTTEAAVTVLDSSGIKDLADKDGFRVYIPTMTNGSTWDSTDVNVYLGILDNTSDAGYSPGGINVSTDYITNETSTKYAGSKELIYLIGEGSGADFINSTLSDKQETKTSWGGVLTNAPDAVLTFNATNEPETTLPIPAFAVNATTEAAAEYKDIDETDTHTKKSSIDIYTNSSHPAQKVMLATSSITDGYDSYLTKKAYSMLLSQVRRRSITMNGDAAVQLYERPDYAALGLNVYDHKEEYVEDADERKHTWYEYVPESVENSDTKVPLVLIFHGGGNEAQYEAETSEFPVLAAKEGFIVVSVQHQDSGIDNETPESIISLLKYLETKLPVDTTRVYASGFSMGSIMTQKLGLLYPEDFAAIAPMDGSQGTQSTKELVMPTIYFAGEESPLPEFPHQESNGGTSNNIDTFIEGLCAINGVNYSGFDSQYGIWGIKADTTYSSESRSGLNEMQVSVLNSDKDGKAYTALVETTSKGHCVMPEEAEVAWNFIKKFSRQADGSIAIAAATTTSSSHHHSSSSSSAGKDSSTSTDGTKSTEDSKTSDDKATQIPSGWQKQSDNTWKLAKDGQIVTGWNQVNGTWYLMDSTGTMQVGWRQTNGVWYLLKSDGAMATGWQESNGKWYYLNADGSMASNTIIDGYAVDESGAWIN